MLVGKVTKRVEVPHEPGEWFQLRCPSGKKLEEARELKQHKLFQTIREMGSEVYQSLGALRSEGDSAPDPLAGYDVDVLLRSGVVGWSYSERVTPGDLDDLDETTRRWAALELIRMAGDSEGDRKNG